MMHQQLLLVIAAIVLAGTTADDDKELIEKERAKLEGQWIVHSTEYGGETTADDNKLTWTFKGEQLTTYIDAKRIQDLTVELQPAEQPKHLDLVPIKAHSDDPTLVLPTRTKCLYSIAKDELKIAITFEFSPGTVEDEKRRALEYAKTRPKGFDTRQGDVMVLTLKRETKNSR